VGRGWWVESGVEVSGFLIILLAIELAIGVKEGRVGINISYYIG
jgi:hypothetical protein